LLNLLIADPHRKESAWVQDLMEEPGFSLTVVGNGEEIVEELRHGLVDGVMINAILPDMTGVKLASLIKKIHPELSTFIIASETTMDLWREASKSRSQLMPLPLDVSKIRFILQSSYSPPDKIESSLNEVAVTTEQEEIEEEEERLEERSVERPEAAPQPIPAPQAALPQPKPKKKTARGGKGVCVIGFSWKGGIGKTTTLVNLATMIQTYTPLQVALIDLTRQTGSILHHFPLIPAITIRNWVEAKPDPSQAMDWLLEDPATELRILPAQTLLDESQKPVNMNVQEALRIVKTLREVVDVIIVDGGTQIDDIQLALIREADHALLISDLDMDTLQENHYMPEILRRNQIELEKVVHIINRAEKGLGITEREAIEMVNTAHAHVIHYHKQLKRKKREREPFISLHPNHAYAEEIRELAGFLLPEKEEFQDKAGLLKKLLRKVVG
jgi:MinD-like ATPase involved in chromosome partitioning or flagellar assembly/DNA-binding NarL/FixJ family response regulator